MLLYRALMGLALPALAGLTLWQRLRGHQPQGALIERLGLAPTGEGAGLWLHGASNGELTSARWLLERLLAERPALRVVVTCNSASARAMVQGWALDRVAVRLAPFDTVGCLHRFLSRWRPGAMIALESELWPERIRQMATLGPVMLVGARISEGSARNWARFAPRLMAATLAQVSLCSAQDQASQARLVRLGLPRARLAPRLMLKARGLLLADAHPLPFPAPAPRARILLAASTHEGEDALILDAFARARAAGRFEHLILAPRHPRRAPAIAALIAARGLSFVTRSKAETPGLETAVYLADTLGEMAHWYAMAGVCVIGGTFADAGGHTPYEPAAYGSALIHGPSVANFAEVFAALDSHGGAIAVADAKALAAALLSLDEPAQARLASAARAVLTPPNDEAALIEAILAHIPVTEG